MTQTKLMEIQTVLRKILKEIQWHRRYAGGRS